MKRLALFYAIYYVFSLGIALPADRDPLDAELIKAGLNGLESNNKDLSGYACKTHRKTTLNPRFLKEGTQTELEGRMEFLVEGPLFFIKNEGPPVNHLGKTHHSWSAFDGFLYQRLLIDEKYLYLKKTEKPEAQPALKMFNDFLMNYEFLPHDLLDSDWAVVDIQNLKNPDEYKLLKNRILKTQNVEYLGEKCLNFDVEGSADSKSGLKTVYSVYLSSKRNFFPIGWTRRITETGKKFIEYSLEEIGEQTVKNGKCFYPKKAVRKFYGGNGEYPYSEEPISVTTIDFSGIGINPKTNGEDFFIDPSLADTLYDADSKAIIKVPK